MSMPIPPHVWERIRQFISAGRYGRVELDITDGRVTNVRFVETIRVRDTDQVELREAS